MKGYSEQRGVQSKVVFDASAGRFAQHDVVHDFEILTKAKAEHPPDAVIIPLSDLKTSGKATPLSRKRRHAVMQTLKTQRAG